MLYFALIPITAIVLGIMFATYESYLKHKREMATLRKDESKSKDELASEYQEFVLGVDSRVQRLEDRIRVLEGRLREGAASEDTQQVGRG